MAPPQELNDRRLTLYEGSALSERDLVRTRAESASAVLLLADRFSPSVHHEDLSIQFQVGRTRARPLVLRVTEKQQRACKPAHRIRSVLQPPHCAAAGRAPCAFTLASGSLSSSGITCHGPSSQGICCTTD